MLEFIKFKFSTQGSAVQKTQPSVIPNKDNKTTFFFFLFGFWAANIIKNSIGWSVNYIF